MIRVLLGGREGHVPDAMRIRILWAEMVVKRPCHGLVLHFYSRPIESEPSLQSGQVQAVKLCGFMLCF